MSKCVAEVLQEKTPCRLASLVSWFRELAVSVPDPDPRRRQANPVAPDVVLRHASRRQQ